MHRLLADSSELERDTPSLSREAAKHLKVLRLGEGEEIELFDGKGSWRAFSHSGGRLRQTGPVMSAPRPSPLTLFACVTKGSRWDWTIEKSTELGVTRIVPVISARTIVRIPKSERAAKRERWLRIAADAARQSDAKWIPDVLEPVDFEASLPLVGETNCFLGALTDPPAPPLLSAILPKLPGLSQLPNLSLFVGPEGDFTPEELAALSEVAMPVSFGTTILRSETAAIYGISVLKSFLDVRPR